MTQNSTIARAATLLALGCALGCSAGGAGASGARAQGGAAGTLGNGGASEHGGTSGGGGGNVAGSSAAGSPGASGVTGSGGVAGSGGSTTTGNAGSGAGDAAGGSGGTGGAATSPCSARPGLLFCDDFESATPGAVPSAPWSFGSNGSGSVAVDDSVPAHSGTKSVHVHGVGFQTFLVYHDPAVLPLASGKFYTRAFVRFGAAMTADHNTFVVADTFAAPGTGMAMRLGEQNQMLMMTVGGDAHGYLSNQNYYNDMLPGVQFAPLAYTCLEMLFDSPGTTIDIWVNGAEVPDLHVTNLAHENYDLLHFGFEAYNGQVSDFWYDDIAIGSQPIGCN